MSYLILAHADDATAPRIAAALTARHGACNVSLVYDHELMSRAHWRHWVASDGSSSFRLTLGSGAQIEEGDISAICNRLRFSLAPHFTQAAAVDREYAEMETFALLLSWLESLAPRVINRASPQSLPGCALDPLLWQAQAARAGLPIARSHATSNLRRFAGALKASSATQCAAFAGALPGAMPGLPAGQHPRWLHEPLRCFRETVTVIGKRVFGKLPRELHVGALKLAQNLGCPVLGVQFVQAEDGRWCFEGLDPCPRLDDAREIEALVAVLEALPRRHPVPAS